MTRTAATALSLIQALRADAVVVVGVVGKRVS
jgi:hypothetical protein